MLNRRRLLPAIGSGLLTLPDRMAHGLIVRDFDAWLRLEFLGLAARSGIADALHRPGTVDDVADRAGLTDRDLLEAVLNLGVSLGELRQRRGRYRARGRRFRAIAGESVDLRGLVEELIVYDNPAYMALESHLRGLPPQPYDADHGRVIADASRIAEPVLGPSLRTLAIETGPRRVLDVGCGSGVYLRHVLEAAPAATGLGLDMDAAAAERAGEELRDLTDAGRCEVRHTDLVAAAAGLGQFDLVLLLNNIYYWAPEERTELLRTVAHLVASGGHLVVASATPVGQAVNRHLDVMLRVTSSSHRLPTFEELAQHLDQAGLEDVSVIEPIPKSGLAMATGRRP